MNKQTKRIAALMVALSLALSTLSFPAFANVDIPQTAARGFGKTAPINPEYIDYIENGESADDGLVPDTKDLS